MDALGDKFRYQRLIIAGFLCLPMAGCHNVKEPVSKLVFADATTSSQLLAGFWWLESGSWRWTAREFAVALQPPPNAEQRGATLSLHLYIPDSQIESLGSMTLAATADDEALEPETFVKGGVYTYTREISKDVMTTSVLPVRFCFDKAAAPERSDGRELAAVVTEVDLETK
ncbi:MAG TPA: hypothetical protein VGL82_07315 [Bryobacteraceae bacterium]|jgi:hypothetical protein